jgi:tetratricopeptide (TPR) repeat protein
VRDDASTDQWLELMVDGRAGLHIQRDEPEQALAVLQTAEPALDARRIPARMHSYYQYLAMGRVMQNRYRVDDGDIASIRRSLEAARSSDDKDIGYATYYVGRLLWLQGRLAEAEDCLQTARALAERIGEIVLLGVTLLGLSLTALRRGDAGVVRSLAPQALTAGGPGPGYTADGAHACLAWLAWQDQRADDVIALSLRIPDPRDEAGSVYPHGWVYLFPLIAARLTKGDVGAAVAASRRLLHSSQQLLPDELTALAEAATTAWDRDQARQSAASLEAALGVARELHYL